MEIVNKKIDNGKAFDWGRTSGDYAKYRDVYPEIFYEKIAGQGLCTNGQKVLDLGTGTGVVPRNMYHYGAQWYGTDISENQIMQAKKLSEELGMEIHFQTVAAEDIDFAENMFDVVTACQCYWYFNYEKVIPKLLRVLKPNGRLLILYMAWLPFEDAIARASEELVLKYNPKWSGAGETRHPIFMPDCIYQYFTTVFQEEYGVDVPFTRETWHGRIKACRGIGASLSEEEIAAWEVEHRKMLQEIAPEEFVIKHYAAMLELRLEDIPSRGSN